MWIREKTLIGKEEERKWGGGRERDKENVDKREDIDRQVV